MIYSIATITKDAQASASRGNDTCRYPFGSEHRTIWVDACASALDAKESASAKMSVAFLTAELV